jgi:hypothetical protein
MIIDTDAFNAITAERDQLRHEAGVLRGFVRTISGTVIGAPRVPARHRAAACPASRRRTSPPSSSAERSDREDSGTLLLWQPSPDSRYPRNGGVKDQSPRPRSERSKKERTTKKPTRSMVAMSAPSEL